MNEKKNDEMLTKATKFYHNLVSTCEAKTDFDEDTLTKPLARLKAWSNRNLSIHNDSLIVHTVVVLTVDKCGLSSTSTNTCTVPDGEDNHPVPVGWC